MPCELKPKIIPAFFNIAELMDITTFAKNRNLRIAIMLLATVMFFKGKKYNRAAGVLSWEKP